jgi:hypothetical protein
VPLRRPAAAPYPNLRVKGLSNALFAEQDTWRSGM